MKKSVLAVSLALVFCFMSMSIVGTSAYAEKEIRVGHLTAISGPASVWGIANSRAMSLGADKINENGGFKVKGETYKWKTIIYDHKYIPAEAVKALNKAIYADKVSLVTIMGGSPTLACIPLLKQNNMISLNDAAGGKSVTNPDNPLVFRHNPGIEASYAVELKYLKEKYGIKTIASLNPDDETGKANAEAIKYVNEKAQFGFDLFPSEFFERGSKDFTAVLTRIIAKKPDLIETGMTDPTSQALVLKQARELGYKGHMLLIWGPDPAQVLKIAGPLAEGAFLGIAITEPGTDEAKDLYERYLKKYPADEWNGNYYTHSALYDCLTPAIEKAQTFNPQVLVKVIEDMKWKGAWGNYSWGGTDLFGIKRQLLMPVTLQTVENGKVIPLIVTDVPPGVLD
ncbi:MAG: ABC transporter substrate-binding protein [Syntrophales bacterium]|jgi:branched-chain amino acid transport system substrate-binding protein|nr:ABC transporter substrate-binding protein [Syntrophales bacterium]MDY0045279.1 ABC transporter substrate-binding protein [Syntrophales bacterium]